MFVRIVLDTCTVRNHTDGCFPQLDLNLVRRKRDLVRISLSASAFVELAAQLADGRLSFARWQKYIAPINAILDQRWPCLPNGKQLGWLAGTQVVEPIENLEDESRYMRTAGTICSACPRGRSAGAKLSTGSRMAPRSIRLDAQTLREIIATQRQEWIDFIRRMQTDLPSRGITGADEETIREVMRSDFGSDPSDAPGVAEKLDVVCRMIASFVACSLRAKTAYNPESEKRRGDTFDLNLLFYVPLPAVIVTGDGRFVRALKQTDAPHARQVLTIDEFNTGLDNGTLAALVSDFQNVRPAAMPSKRVRVLPLGEPGPRRE